MVAVFNDAPEVWRVCPTSPQYQVSNLGRVIGPRGRLLKPWKDTSGYLQVRGNPGAHSVHRMVAAAFIGPCPAGHEVAHKDHDRANARLDNLEYLTHDANVKATAAAGRSMRGEAHVSASITEETAKAIIAEYSPLGHGTDRRRQPGTGMAFLARKHNTTLRVVRGIVHGETWRHLPRKTETVT